MIKYLIENEKEINENYIRIIIKDNFGESPLFFICLYVLVEMNKSVKYLVEYGVNINKEFWDEDTPVFYTCKGRNKIFK
ncbi:ankyrin [Neocallimastix lanati (nom. inval.)]|nr:ankyrin [Neocallimastix sp. JGI-2020a]